ncbi:hypothetical protein ZHAS_00011614 [Anopheles sinensis]|uniref:Uncharacterized protein n=1 Tax=Anopheles sinensis TaxID=74873 RepID=A0A084W0Y6_ANOSI|nr:hypothetical protein ZHAS_00011614 [Anopheles sinensis]
MQQPRYSPAPPPPVTIRPQMAPRHQTIPNLTMVEMLESMGNTAKILSTEILRFAASRR